MAAAGYATTGPGHGGTAGTYWQSDQAQERRAETQRRHTAAKAGWQPSDLPEWLTEESYLREIQPRLKEITLSVIASKLEISIPYAVDVRSARRVPHPRHWPTLAQIVGISAACLSPARLP
jgi:hypothetical protein